MKPVLLRNNKNVVVGYNRRIVGLGMSKLRHHGMDLSTKMKHLKIKGGATPVRRIEQIQGGRMNKRPISFMP